jgi:hypothetical protein
MSEKWLIVEEAVELTGYCARHLQRLARQGKVTAKKKSGLWFIDRDSLLEHKATAKRGRRWPSKEAD